MEMTVQSKILKTVLTKIILKSLKKNIDDSLNLSIEDLEVVCEDDRISMNVSLFAAIDTNRIPELLKKYGVL